MAKTGKQVNMTALLVIDMQKGSFGPGTPRFEQDEVVEKINRLASNFRKQKLPVIYIQHDGTGTGGFEKHTREWENLDQLNVEPGDILMDKYANDVFYQSELQSRLDELKVNELVITGGATDFCIASSIQSALSKDYRVVVVKDGHTAADRPHLTAKQVIDHYNWVWAHLIPTKGSVVVKTFQ